MAHFDLEKELAEQDPLKDWTFAASSIPCITTIFEIERKDLLPAGEVQQGVDDTMDCASRAPVNILEVKFNWLLKKDKILPELRKWLADNGYVTESGVEFSDAFVAINSGTTRNGNSLKAPLEAIRTKGLIPKSLLPLKSNMTFEDYHDPKRITSEMVKLGEEFLKRFKLNYDQVKFSDFEIALEYDMLDVAGYAWPEPVNGEYPAVPFTPNHAFMIFSRPMSFIFDNYYDVVDNDFIKKLAKDYRFFDYGYRVIISSQQIPTKEKAVSFWSWLLSLFKFPNLVLEK